MLGGGLLSFGVVSGGTNMRDISGEPHTTGVGRYFNHIIPFGEWFTLSITYTFNYMSIEVNREIRYWSDKERYMKSKVFPERNREGLPFKLTCEKHSELWIKDCTITEYEDDAPNCVKPVENVPPFPLFFGKGDKVNFEYAISGLSHPLREEIKATDRYVLGLQPAGFKRKISKGGVFARITYITEYGFAYHIHTDNNMAVQYVNWILYNTRREQAKYGGTRKRELTAETLSRLGEADPDFAERMYANLAECVGCACMGRPKPCGLDGCIICEKKTGWYLCPTLISFGDKRMAACHGKMEFTATPSGFADARRVIGAVNELLRDGFTHE
jgi:hypothetical protein